MSVLDFLGDIAFPSAMQRMREREYGQQAKQIIGQRGQQYQPGAGQGMLENIPSQGLLGGPLTPERVGEAGAQLLKIPGYENLGMNMMSQFRPHRAPDPYFSPLQTSTGLYRFNARSGEIEPLMGETGQLKGPSIDPYVQAEVAGAREAGKISGKTKAEALANLPSVLSNAQQMIGAIDMAIQHPGRETATGKSGLLDPRNYMPGTDAYNFKVLADQLQGKAFLEAYQSLKGGGQITEIEGQKAENAIARLNRAQSDEEYVKSLTELRDIVTRGQERARQQAGISESDFSRLLGNAPAITSQGVTPMPEQSQQIGRFQIRVK